MRRVWAIPAILAVALLGADKKKAPKPPDVEVIEASARRGGEKIALDGRVRNSGLKPVRGLVLVFDFLAPGKQVITTQKGAVDEESLDLNAEAAFHVELNAPPRAVQFQIGAVDEAGRDLRVAKPGPYAIE